jgi:uncharacterized integral membrane protein
MSQEPRQTTTPMEQVEERDFLDQVKIGAAVIGIVALVLFFVQNQTNVPIHFLWMTWHVSMIVALVVTTALGAALALLALTIRGRRARRVRKR